jgi:hypothetical protein
MKQLLISVMLIAGSESLFSQVQFVQGYYVTNDGQRTECQIRFRSEDWRDNPKSFEYRANETAEPREADLDRVTELGLASGETFFRIRVAMDRSTNNLNQLDTKLQTNELRSPVFASETLFLRLLVSGSATLYQYNEGNLLRFFLSVSGGPVNQLVYKRYFARTKGTGVHDRTKDDMFIAVNEDYKQQLLNDLKCTDIRKQDIEGLSYDADKLKGIVSKYNSCKGGASVTYEKSRRSGWPMHLTFRLGLASNSLDIKNISFGGGGTANIEGVASPRMGLELEGVLPFGEGLWAIPIEAAYQTFSGQIPSGSVKIDYSFVDILIGIRRYFTLGESGRLYFTGSILLGLSQGSTIKIVSTTYSADAPAAIVLTAGYKMKRFSGEIYYAFPKNLMSKNGVYEAIMPSIALNLGYTFSK